MSPQSTNGTEVVSSKKYDALKNRVESWALATGKTMDDFLDEFGVQEFVRLCVLDNLPLNRVLQFGAVTPSEALLKLAEAEGVGFFKFIELNYREIAEEFGLES